MSTPKPGSLGARMRAADEDPAPPKVLEFTSPDSSTVIYACSWCSLTVPGNSRERAEACCRCQRCHEKPAVKHRTLCASCGADAQTERDEHERRRALALPVVDDHVGPVYVDAWARFFETADEAAEYGLDMGHDIDAEVVVYPCQVGRAGVPVLEEIVEEAWAVEFDDPDDVDIALSEKASAALATGVEILEAEAPTVWRPDLTRRVVLPELDG